MIFWSFVIGVLILIITIIIVIPGFREVAFHNQSFRDNIKHFTQATTEKKEQIKTLVNKINKPVEVEEATKKPLTEGDILDDGQGRLNGEPLFLITAKGLLIPTTHAAVKNLKKEYRIGRKSKEQKSDFELPSSFECTPRAYLTLKEVNGYGVLFWANNECDPHRFTDLSPFKLTLPNSEGTLTFTPTKHYLDYIQQSAVPIIEFEVQEGRTPRMFQFLANQMPIKLGKSPKADVQLKHCPEVLPEHAAILYNNQFVFKNGANTIQLLNTGESMGDFEDRDIACGDRFQLSDNVQIHIVSMSVPSGSFNKSY